MPHMDKPLVLASDLDGTLIPLDDEPQNRADLAALDEQLSSADMQLIYVTGRHLASVLSVMQTAGLPVPNWIIADVGTSIYQRVATSAPGSFQPDSSPYQLAPGYAAELAELVGDFSVQRVAELLASISALRLQEAEKQSRFKLSYYVDRQHLEVVHREIAGRLELAAAPYSIVSSVDPFNGDGLIDLLPRQVTKAYGIGWWAAHQGIERCQILYAGDSGNDSAVFAAGFRSIVVGNAAHQVRQSAEQANTQAGWRDRLYLAQQPATSGVLAGLRHFLFP